MTIDPESKRKAIETTVTVLVVGGVCALTASYAFLALEGLIAWVAVGAGTLMAWGFAAPFKVWVANKRIAALKAVIAENPIETMENIAAEKQAELNAQSKAITAVNTQYLNVQTKLDNLPEKLKSKATNFQAIADKLKQGLDNMRKRYDFAAKELLSYRGQIDEASSLWEVACAVNAAIKVSEKAKMDVFRDIKNKVAFDTVTTSLNHAFAALDEEVRLNQTITDLGSPEPEQPKQLTQAVVEGEVIDLTAKRSGSTVTIRG